MAELNSLSLAEKQSHLKSIVETAINELLDRDNDLITIGAHEQAICHRLALYLEKYTNLNVDCEYNRHLASPKEILHSRRRPDILIHKRLDDTANLLIIEMKARSNTETSDEEKIKALVDQSGEYKYTAGLFLRVENKKEEVLRSGEIKIKAIWFTSAVSNPCEYARPCAEDALKELRKADN